ncbi:MAG: threonine/serine exporter family protein [Clostridia bacterium]|nr:threonine/serine exporter family protein [Clostridia bacterium]
MGILDIVLNLIFAFIATAGFCVVFNIPKKHMLFCGMLGVVSWLIYIFLRDPIGPVGATFIATAAVMLLSRIFAVVRKCPVTILLMPGIIPLAPGSAIYYTAYYFVTNDAAKAAEYAFMTIKIAFAIVLGIIVIIAIPFKRSKKPIRNKQ